MIIGELIMKKLFVYFSSSGNGEFLASLFLEKGYETIKVETLKPIGKMNFFKMIKLGGTTISKKGIEIKDIDLQINEDDVVVIGSPIWNDRISSPIKAFLNKFELNKDTTQFVLYSAGGDGKHAFKQLEKMGFKNIPLLIKSVKKNPDLAKNAIKEF